MKKRGMLLTDVSSMEDTTGASNTDGSFDSGAAAAADPLAAQPQHVKKNKNLWSEMGCGDGGSSVCAWNEMTHLHATGRAGTAAAGGSGGAGVSPRFATRRRAASLPPPLPLLLSAPPGFGNLSSLLTYSDFELWGTGAHREVRCLQGAVGLRGPRPPACTWATA